ncbi:hypothetical protein A1507_19205 [Methylomonas koyamae]|uniref:Uncharacterized protein n=1 Tax=Methylomonas koyamae TaxID=702114 RepID=A0A177N2A5_9GAMM|nr:hypothetical protein [Methylomonas koyamae]OAI12117.1 hypothetical protein A1507_19205 [Methylomonas koyamae]
MTTATKEFGKTTFDQLVQLIELVNSQSALKAEFFDIIKGQPDVLRNIFDSDFAWAEGYELSLLEQIAVFSVVSGFNQALAEIASADDPQAAAMEAFHEDDSSSYYPGLDDDEEQRKTILATLMPITKSLESIRLYGLSINDLVARIQRRDQSSDAAIFKVLRIDRSAVSCPCIADRIALAEIEDDQAFFKKLKNALSGPPLKPRDEYGVVRYVLYLLNEDGILDQLSPKDRYQLFCERLAIYPDDGEDAAKSLDQFIWRWKKEFST